MNPLRLRVALFLFLTLLVGWWWVNPSLVTIVEYVQGDIATEMVADAPLASVTATTTRIVFTGDVFLGRDVEDGARQLGYEYPLHIFTQAPMTTADAIVVNFEAPVPLEHQPTPDLGMQFSVATSALPALAAAGVTHAGLANNHTGDYGSNGLLHTRSQLQAAGIDPFGSPWSLGSSSVAFIDTVKGQVAVIGIHAVATQPLTEDVEDIFSALPDTVTEKVVYVHWGNEYQLKASAQQRALANQLVAAGADLIIGHHPHVVQDIEIIEGVPVIYSLGNTIFDQYFSTDVQTGLLLSVEWESERRSVQLYPISSIGSRTRPYLMPARERSVFLHDLADRSDSGLSEAIRSGRLSW